MTRLGGSALLGCLFLIIACFAAPTSRPDEITRHPLSALEALQLAALAGDAHTLGYARMRKADERATQPGWFSRWLTMGGEGTVTVLLDDQNLTLPHRPSAFPAHLVSPTSLPISGFLERFDDFPEPHSVVQTERALGGTHNPGLACVGPAWPPVRFQTPKPPFHIAFIERGGCDFATKVRAAQERGAAGVIVGDSVARIGESDDEGRERENLITMFSPEDTMGIFIPSVFVSRSSFLLFRDLLDNGTDSRRPDGRGLWIEISEGQDEAGALSSLLSFALLLPSIFLLATIAIHRVRLARQREADRAPPLVVLSLPERIWSPDIVWEKDDSAPSSPASPSSPSHRSLVGGDIELPPPPPISPADVASPPAEATEVDDELGPLEMQPSSSRKHRKPRRKSKRYYSKDECAICMDMFERGDVVRILPCGHVFHKTECDEWLLKWRKLCPTCRADVTAPPGSPTSPQANAMQGTTLTPVAPIDAVEEEEARPTFLNRIAHLRESAWTSIRRLGRRPENAEIDETTPLFPRYDEEDRDGRASDVTVRPPRRDEGTV